MIYIVSAFLGLVVGYILKNIVNKKKNYSFKKLYERENEPLQYPSLLEEKLRYQSYSEFIFRFVEVLSFTLDRQKLIQCVTEAINNFMPVERTVLALRDKVSGNFRIESAVGWKIDPSPTPFLTNKDNVSEFFMHHAEPVVINDLQQEEFFNKFKNETYLNKSFISVPIIFKKETLGVLLACGKKDGKPFTENDLSLVMNIANISAIALNNVEIYEETQNNYLNTITALAFTIDARDRYTEYHSRSVAKYSVAIAQHMQLSFAEVELIKRAALLHDIGKIGIKDAVLLKEGRLTSFEREHMELHAAKGEEIIKTLPFLKEVAVLIRQHHERYDGSGYPDGIKGLKIELGARILAVADAFDAMITNRPYRRAIPLEEALGELERCKGREFDPEIVKYLREIIIKQPNIVKPI